MPKVPHEKKKPLSNAERQRRFRARRDARLSEAEAALRNGTGASTTPALRNVASRREEPPEDPTDEMLTRQRQRGDQLVAGYLALLRTPGLSSAEVQAIVAHFTQWKKLFADQARTSPRRLDVPEYRKVVMDREQRIQ